MRHSFLTGAKFVAQQGADGKWAMKGKPLFCLT
jgi:hypothetical protein